MQTKKLIAAISFGIIPVARQMMLFNTLLYTRSTYDWTTDTEGPITADRAMIIEASFH